MSDPSPPSEKAAPPERTKFGTFGGVFTPSILTILGVIMFMRASFVIGNAGVLAAIGILIAAKAITFSTGLSLSAIGTNMQVRGGRRGALGEGRLTTGCPDRESLRASWRKGGQRGRNGKLQSANLGVPAHVWHLADQRPPALLDISVLGKRPCESFSAR